MDFAINILSLMVCLLLIWIVSVDKCIAPYLCSIHFVLLFVCIVIYQSPFIRRDCIEYRSVFLNRENCENLCGLPDFLPLVKQLHPGEED